MKKDTDRLAEMTFAVCTCPFFPNNFKLANFLVIALQLMLYYGILFTIKTNNKTVLAIFLFIKILDLNFCFCY